MQGEQDHQPEPLHEASDPDPPSHTALRKLSNLLITEELESFDIEDRLHPNQQPLYVLMAETDTPLSREEIAAQLGYSSITEVSHIESAIFTRMSRWVSDEVRKSHDFQKLIEQRAEEHAKILEAEAAAHPEPEQKPPPPPPVEPKPETTKVSAEAVEPQKVTQPTPQVSAEEKPPPPAEVQQPQRKKTKRRRHPVTIRVDPTRVRPPAPKTKPPAPIDVAPPPEPKATTPLPPGKHTVRSQVASAQKAMSLAQIERERVETERDEQITALRITILTMDKLLKRRGRSPGQYLIPIQLRTYNALRDDRNDNTELPLLLNLRPRQLLERGQRIINSLVRRAADSLAFPLPPETPVVTPSPHRFIPAPPPSPLETLRQIDKLLASHQEDVFTLLAPTPIFQNKKSFYVFCDLLDERSSIRSTAAQINVSHRRLNTMVEEINLALAERAPHILGFTEAPQADTLQQTDRPQAAMHLRELLVRSSKGNMNEVIALLASQGHVLPAAFRLVLQGATHPPLATCVIPVLTFADAAPETSEAIKEMYMRERLPVVMRVYKIPYIIESGQEDGAAEDEHLPLTPLQQLSALLQQKKINIRNFISANLIDVYDTLSGSFRPRQTLSRTYAISVESISRIESYIMKDIVGNLPPSTLSEAVRYLEMASEAEARMLAPIAPFTPVGEDTVMWASESRQREAILEMDAALKKVGQDPLRLLKRLRKVPAERSTAELVYPLLANTSRTLDHIYYDLNLRRRTEVTQAISQISRAFADALQRDGASPEVPASTQASSTPGEFLSNWRRQQKSTRGDEASVEQLARVAGISKGAIQKYFRGATHPPADRVLIPLARYLKIDETQLEKLIEQENELLRVQEERAQAGRKKSRSLHRPE